MFDNRFKRYNRDESAKYLLNSPIGPKSPFEPFSPAGPTCPRKELWFVSDSTKTGFFNHIYLVFHLKRNVENSCLFNSKHEFPNVNLPVPGNPGSPLSPIAQKKYINFIFIMEMLNQKPNVVYILIFTFQE